MKHDQFTLPFLDTTIVAEGFGLYGRIPNCEILRPCADELRGRKGEALDAPVPTKPSLPAQDYRLVGDRRLAESWKGRAEDNLAAIRLMTAIEAEGRHARPDEQERLAKFTAFGAVDLADKLFRRAGEGFRARLGRSRRRTRAARLARRPREPSSGPRNTRITRRSS